MTVDPQTRTIDFSGNLSGEVDVEIMSKLRDALENNSAFSRLIFDNNRLSEESIGMLAAIIKTATRIDHLSLVSCGIRDVDLMHISNAICTKKCLHYLVLAKNPEITSESCGEIARIIRTVPFLRSVDLTATKLQATGCAALVTAAQQSASLEALELPYTVGFKVLEAVKAALDRSGGGGGGPARPAAPAARRDSPALPPLVAPALGGLRDMGPRHWVDPAIRAAAAHLLVLDARCQRLREHKEERRRELLARRGLGEGGHAAQRGRSCAHFKKRTRILAPTPQRMEEK